MFPTATALSVDGAAKAQLESLVRSGTTPQRVAQKCRVILLAQEGMSNHSIAKQLGLSRPTVIAARAPFGTGVGQALDRTAPILPLRPGLPERQTHDYKRYGTTTLFAAFNILNGKVIGSCLPRHRGKEFAKFLNQVEKQVPPDLDVHIILDNYSTHKSATVKRGLKSRKHRHFYFYFTPTSSSWLNQVECFFALITERMIRRGTFRSVEELERAIYAWLANWNNKPQPFVCQATADVILDKVRRCEKLAGTPH